MKYLTEYKLFEYATGEKHHSWSKEDRILTYYYYKFGLDKIGVKNQTELSEMYIGAVESSLIMNLQNIKYCLSKIKDEQPEGLSHTPPAYYDIISEFSRMKEPELREIVLKILDSKDKEENLRKVREEKERLKKERIEKEQLKKDLEKSKISKKSKKLSDTKLTKDKDFQEGDKVTHTKFGDGEILGLSDKFADVKFEEGRKKILKDFLTKIY